MPNSDELFRQTQKLAALMQELRERDAQLREARSNLENIRERIRRFLVLECHCRVMPWRKPNPENSRRQAKAAKVAQSKREGTLHDNAHGDNAASKIIHLEMVLPTPPPKRKRGIRRGDAA